MAKKKTSHKEEKPIVTERPKAIDWDSMPQMVTVIVGGKEILTHKSNAQVLVKAKRAELK